MLDKISRNWWMFALRGLVAVIFGVLALVMHEQVLQSLMLVFGAFALVTGVVTVFTALSTSPYFSRWWVLLLEGFVGIACGLMGIFNPDLTARALVYVIAIWALFTGIAQIAVAIQFRSVLSDEWMLVLGGVLSIILSALLFIYPAAGEVSMTWMIGLYAIILGISEIVFAFRLRGLRTDYEKAIEGGFKNSQTAG